MLGSADSVSKLFGCVLYAMTACVLDFMFAMLHVSFLTCLLVFLVCLIAEVF